MSNGDSFDEGGSSEIPNCVFWVDSSDSRSLVRVFLYHHATARPPAKAEAAATHPSFCHARFPSPPVEYRDKASESKVFSCDDPGSVLMTFPQNGAELRVETGFVVALLDA
jgi:hypothetical protein